MCQRNNCANDWGRQVSVLHQFFIFSFFPAWTSVKNTRRNSSLWLLVKASWVVFSYMLFWEPEVCANSVEACYLQCEKKKEKKESRGAHSVQAVKIFQPFMIVIIGLLFLHLVTAVANCRVLVEGEWAQNQWNVRHAYIRTHSHTRITSVHVCVCEYVRIYPRIGQTEV